MTRVNIQLQTMLKLFFCAAHCGLKQINPTRGSIWNASRVAGGGADSRNPFLGHFESMGGIVIAIWEKSNFFRSIGSLKCTKNAIFLQGGQNLPPLPLVGLIDQSIDEQSVSRMANHRLKLKCGDTGMSFL